MLSTTQQMVSIKTNMDVRNGAGFVCQFESNRRHLIDVWSFITVNLQHIPCNGQTAKQIYITRKTRLLAPTTTTDKSKLV